jgi:serine/threonine protein kinase
VARPNDPPATGDTTRPFGEVLDPPETQLFRGVLPLGAPPDSSPNASMQGTLHDAPAPSPPAARPTAATAQRLGPFVVERELARGGMGIVYVARHEQLGRRVALKVLKAGAWADPEEAERFRFEAQAAARLKHPSIVGLHEVGQQDGAWYLAMDLVEGPGSLHAILERDGPLEPRRAAKLVEGVARAVHYAHTRSVLHRDIKPHNVLIDADDAPHLTDFGLAKDIGAAEKGFTVTGQVLGTPAYMAPEQAVGDPALVDRRSDVYGLGAALYTCLVGHAPFRGHGVMDVLRKVIEEEPAAPSSLRSDLDRDRRRSSSRPCARTRPRATRRPTCSRTTSRAGCAASRSRRGAPAARSASRAGCGSTAVSWGSPRSRWPL